ncbi:protein white-like [Lingula anatina]|uniref:Protein white-like n=1 Tax=Lingula anatina TaxID=7574 RepID=A0A1S3HKR3_LINAN|nr:protein white-like [Lingula anatina]|eukprot:XP_013386693.1 protein white-like [Lingula anatina]
MNVLTYRNRGNLVVDGTVKVNGKVIGPGITNVSVYVQQEDLFIGVLTVREHLQFQAQLRMDREVPFEERMDRVEEVIEETGLSKCADTRIGIPGRIKGISGGEMKRLSFASEALTDPPLMFCDEPTSGLDSFMAESIVHTLKTMARKGKTILCTIHQPSSQVFAMFDQLLLLAEGRVAYMGPTAGAFKFFQELNFTCPPNFNPADHFIHTLAIKPGQVDTCKQRVNEICDGYDSSPFSKAIQDNMAEQGQENGDNFFLDAAISGKAVYKANWFQQFRAVFWRSWLTMVRDPMAYRIRTIQSIFIAVLLGLIYLRQPDKNEGYYDQSAVQNINGLMFLLLTNNSFANMFPVINTFPLEIPVFKRDHNNGMYRTDVYFLCKTFAEFPSYVITPLIFSAIAYWMVGLYPGGEEFLFNMAVLILVANCAVSFGYIISTAANSLTVALALAPPLLIPFMLFGGFFLNQDSVPVYFIWLNYMSWFPYSNEVITVVQWRNVDTIRCHNGTSCAFRTGQDIIDYYSFKEENILRNILLLVALLVGYRLIAYIIFLIKTWKRE